MVIAASLLHGSNLSWRSVTTTSLTCVTYHRGSVIIVRRMPTDALSRLNFASQPLENPTELQTGFDWYEQPGTLNIYQWPEQHASEK